MWKNLRLFKVSYTAGGIMMLSKMLNGTNYTIVVARDEKHAVKEFYRRAVHAGDDITDIEEYEVKEIE